MSTTETRRDTTTNNPSPRRPSRAMRLARPLVARNPLTGERALMLAVEHEDECYTCTLEYNRRDALNPCRLGVGLSPDPASTRAALGVLVALNRQLWQLRDRATARDDGPGAELWNDAARRLLVYRTDLGDELYAQEERRAQRRPLPADVLTSELSCDDEAVAYG